MILTRIQDRRRRTAFTLVEVLIVMAIIVVIMSIGGIYAFRAYEDANKKAARAGAEKLAQAAQIYFTNYKAWPDSLNALVSPPDGQPYAKASELNDPWGQPYQYDANGPNNNRIKPDVWTTAKDGTVIGNWD